MLDLFHFPSDTKNYVQKFYCTGSSWTVWEKPRGVSMLFIFLLGGGSGGGGGFTGGSGTNRGGGGGGGCSAVTRLLIPTIFLPDRLYVQVGEGGAGGAVATNGSLGQPSFISVAPDSSAPFLVLGGNTVDFGDAGTTAGGVGGTGATVFSTGRYSNFGNLLSLAGTNGANGGTGAGSSITFSTTTMLTGGGGGGGSAASNANGVGGDINLSGFLITDITGGAGSNPPGKPGFYLSRPFTCTGGSGGSGHGTASGGKGGDAGGYGCGGGGGGGGTVSGGEGGKGSDGFILMVGW